MTPLNLAVDKHSFKFPMACFDKEAPQEMLASHKIAGRHERLAVLGV
jgi:hypothetical protein